VATTLRSASLLTVAIRGYFATKMRVLSETTGMSLAKLFKTLAVLREREQTNDIAAAVQRLLAGQEAA